MLGMHFRFSPSNQTIFPAVPGAEPSSLKKACDKCRERRIRCIIKGSGPCEKCQSLGIACTFLYVQKPRGRKKGVKINVVKKLESKDPSVRDALTFIFEHPQILPDTPLTSSSQPTPTHQQEYFTPPAYDPTMPHFYDLKKFSLSLGQL
ncbi:hypothetical protein DSO57_1024294 [Entomophthora muscae]|uniref:Uncharacterized protein n=1 Tax=Entomophthora muscae TaxID=34485 RepID=A0ACC2TPR0_9FUNG|nr:hypothetical protein DSO57_1024294 [Entomophthora muscae]